MREILQQLHDLMRSMQHPRALDVEQLIELHETDLDAFWQTVNSNALWAGAGSLASETMMDNPGWPAPVWQMHIQTFREILIELGTRLRQRGGENPGIGSWISAFESWNRSGH